MATVKPTNRWRFVAVWSADGAEKTRVCSSKAEADAFVDGLPEGRVERRENGEKSWTVRYRDARGRGRSQKFNSHRDARLFAASVETDKARGVFIDPKLGEVLFKDYADEWLTNRSLADSSRAQMESRLRVHIYPVLGDRQVRSIRPADVEAWLNGLTSLSESTRLTIFANLRAIFTSAVANELVAKNPCVSLSFRPPKPEKVLVKPWTVDMVAGTYEHLPARYKLAAALGAGLGLRQGEVFGLSLDDVDFEGGFVRIQRAVNIAHSRLHFAPPKYYKSREVPLAKDLAKLIKAHVAAYPPKPVTLPWTNPRAKGRFEHRHGDLVTVTLLLTSRESKALNKNYINDYVWKVATSKTGIDSTKRENGMHALRHHYASTLLDAGENIKAVSEYLGHASAVVTLETYSHVMPTSPARTRKAISKAFQKGILRGVQRD